jgi:hypothetical protein
METTLWNASHQRQITTIEGRMPRVTAPRFVTVVTTTCGLTGLATNTSTDSLAGSVGNDFCVDFF